MRPFNRSQLTRRESRKALLHWQRLYSPPPIKQRPDVASGGPEEVKNKAIGNSKSTLSPEDFKRERLAHETAAKLVATRQREYLDQLNGLLRGRSAAVVATMEAARGLR